jgi:teichoic acid transport system ATP-binding protein
MEAPSGTQGQTLIEAVGVGVKYTLGRKREDLQSLAYNMVLRRKKKETFWALKAVDLIGSPGDILGIIGGNGAGKTTLCRVLSGLLRPDTGRLHLGGRVSALLALGTGFNAQLSGRENIFLNGLMLGLSRSQTEALLPEIVEFSGLERFLDEPLKHYSSGMKARLGFSIAVTIEPEILIMDEALGVGDLEFSEKAGRRMQELVGKAKMVIVVTHQMNFVERYCTCAL